MTFMDPTTVKCRWCGREHSDWLSCTAAELLDAPQVPYTSGGQVIEQIVRVLETESEVPENPKFDRSAWMKDWHAKRREEKLARKRR